MKKLLTILFALAMVLAVPAWGVQTFQGNVSGNAATVTTNANLTGPVTSTGNATVITEGNAHKAATMNLGTDKTVNGTDFTGTPPTGWAADNCALAAVGGQLQVTTTATALAYAYQNYATIAGHAYKFTVTFQKGTASGGGVIVGTNYYNSDIWSSGALTDATPTVHQVVIVAVGAQTFISLVGNGSASQTTYFDNVSFTEVPLTVNGDAYLTGNVRAVIPTFTDNAAAVAGGLVAGQLYRVNAATDPEPLYVVH